MPLMAQCADARFRLSPAGSVRLATDDANDGRFAVTVGGHHDPDDADQHGHRLIAEPLLGE